MMDFVIGKIDINLVGEQPFVHKDPTLHNLWPNCLKILKENHPLKQLSCASDAYITESTKKIPLSDLFGPKKLLQSPEIYVSHVFHQNGASVDPELDDILLTPECLAKVIKQFRIKRLVAGAAGTGTALHQHSRAYFHNILGTKRWFLASPNEENTRILSEFSYDVKNKKIHSIGDWFSMKSTELSEELSGCNIIDLGPGESLFIPDGYYHAVLNMTFTTGIAYSWEKRFQIDV